MDQHAREVADELERRIRIPLFPDCVMKYPDMSSLLSRYPKFAELWDGPDFPWDVSISPPKARTSAELRREVLAKYDSRCWICGQIIEGSFDVHHIVSEAEFGPTKLANLVPVHRECHRTAGLAKNGRSRDAL